MEARRGHVAAACGPQQTGGCANRRHVDQHRPRLDDVGWWRIASDDRCPVEGVDDELRTKRHEDQQRKESHTPADLVEDLRWEHR